MRQLFHSLQFADADAGISFLRAVGFTEALCVRDEAGKVVHAEFHWRDTGAVMFGSTMSADETEGTDRRSHADDGTPWVRPVGSGQCYCVVESDDEVDAAHAAALAAGGSSILAPAEQEYGGRGCTVRDAEGNQWSFGSYRGAGG